MTEPSTLSEPAYSLLTLPMSSRRSARKRRRPKVPGQPAGILAQILIGDDLRMKGYVRKGCRKRRPSDPDWDEESEPLPPRISKPRPKKPKPKPPPEAESLTMPERPRSDSLEIVVVEQLPERLPVEERPEPPQKAKSHETPLKKPRRDLLELALAERLALEKRAEAATLKMDLPPTKRPRVAAIASIHRRKIVDMLTEDEPLSPAGDPEEDSERDPEEDPEQDPGLDPEEDPEPYPEEDPEFPPEQDPEFPPAENPEFHPKQGPLQDPDLDPGPCPAAGPDPKAALAPSQQEDQLRPAEAPGDNREEKAQAAEPAAQPVTEVKLDPDALRFGEATGAEGRLANSMILPKNYRRIPFIPWVIQLRARARIVHQAGAEYRDLLSASDREPPPEPPSDCAPPADSCGQPLLQLRQRLPPDRRRAAPTPVDLTALLEEHRASARNALLPPANMQQALDMIQALRLQNLDLQAALLRTGAEPLRPPEDAPAPPGQLPPKRRGRGDHKPLVTLTAVRLARLERLEAGVERSFSPGQMDVLRGGEDNRSIKKWSEDDLRRAIELRAMCSRKVYEHVRGAMGLPLPCINTLQLGVKRYPELQEALARALGDPNPRCPTCRRNRDDATTVEMRRRYDAPPRPRRPKKQKPEGPAGPKKGKPAAPSMPKPVREQGKNAEKGMKRAKEQRTSWTLVKKEAVPTPVPTPWVPAVPVRENGAALDAEASDSSYADLIENEVNEALDEASSGSSSDEDSSADEDEEAELTPDEFADECPAVTRMRRKLARRGMWMGD